MASAAGTLKRITLELGGNDPAIVLEDVDVNAIAPKLFFAASVNSGQVCMAIKRIYAHDRIYEALCEALTAEARKAVVGDGFDPKTQLGPIQNRKQYERVQGILDDTKRRGARILAGGEVPPGRGYFVPPTIVADVPDDSRLVQEEQFGPIVPVLQVHRRRRRRAPCQRHALWPERLGVEQRRRTRDGHRRAARSRHGVGESAPRHLTPSCRSEAPRSPASDASIPRSASRASWSRAW